MEKEKQAERGAKECLKLSAGGMSSGLRYPHGYGRDASPYFYGLNRYLVGGDFGGDDDVPQPQTPQLRPVGRIRR